MASCCWKDCAADGIHEERDRNGDVWTVLCQVHHDELGAAVSSMDARRLLGAWARARANSPATKRANAAMAASTVRLAQAVTAFLKKPKKP